MRLIYKVSEVVKFFNYALFKRHVKVKSTAKIKHTCLLYYNPIFFFYTI